MNYCPEEVYELMLEYLKEIFLERGYEISFSKDYSKSTASFGGLIKEMNERGALAIECSKVTYNPRDGNQLSFNLSFAVGIKYKHPLGQIIAQEVIDYNENYLHYFTIKILNRKVLYISKNISSYFLLYSVRGGEINKYKIKANIKEITDTFFGILQRDSDLNTLIAHADVENHLHPFFKGFFKRKQ